MYLLNTSSLELEYFDGHDVPPYAILSHRWGSEEVTFQDVQGSNARDKAGYKKLEGTCALAKTHGFEYVWIDTCCIDKTSSAELSEAINSMFLWYQEATVCYVYLADVPHRHQSQELQSFEKYVHEAAIDASFRKSSWFKRGWTLQELLAPAMVIFLDEEWAEIGTKQSLSSLISNITSIPVAVLEGTMSIDEISIATRMSWAAFRDTARIEDTAYCLLGIFNVNMPIMYGERERAFMRLQEEIFKVTDDHSVFAWRHREGFHPRHSKTGASMHFAYFPFEFMQDPIVKTGIEDLVQSYGLDGQLYDESIFVDNRGIHLRLPLFRRRTDSGGEEYWLLLPCRIRGSEVSLIENLPVGMSLTRAGPRLFVRGGCRPMGNELMKECFPVTDGDVRICIQRVNPLRRHAIQLVDAARKGEVTEVKFFLDRGVVDDSVYPSEEDALQKILYGSRRTRELKKRGLRSTALAYAVWEGPSLQVVDELLQRPSGWEQLSGPGGEGLVSLAAMVGNVDMVELLLRKLLQDGSDEKVLPAWAGQVLGDAAHWGNETVVKLILQLGVDANRTLPWMEGRTSLSVAAGRGHLTVVELLLAESPEVDAMDENGRTALSWATYSRNSEIVEVLIANGADPNLKDNNGRTPLSWAAEYGNEAATGLLLEEGANFEEEDSQGLTPMEYARRESNRGVVRALLRVPLKAPGVSEEMQRELLAEVKLCRGQDQQWVKQRHVPSLEKIVTARRKRWVREGK